jgi:hypothetical protein
MMATNAAGRWFNTDPSPFPQRWDRAVADLRALDENHPLLSSPVRDEPTLFVIKEHIADLRARKAKGPTPFVDENLEATLRELGDLERRYSTGRNAIIAAQRKLGVAARSKTHELLGDISADLFVIPHPPDQRAQPRFVDRTQFTSAMAASSYVKTFLGVVLNVEAKLAAINSALIFEEQPVDIQAKEMVLRLADVVKAQEQRIGDLEAQLKPQRKSA